MEIFVRKRRGGKVGNLPPTPWVICETTQPELLLGGPTPCACPHHVPGASRPTCYTSVGDICTQGASLTPDIPPSTPFVPCNNIGGCNLLAAAPHPVPEPQQLQSPSCTEEHSPCPQPPPSSRVLRGKHDCEEQMAPFSLQDKRLSP